MYKVNFTYLFISFFIIVFIVGCGAKTNKVEPIDFTNKSIIIGGTGMFSGALRSEFKKRGWLVTTQIGKIQTMGQMKNDNIDIQTGMNYKAKYLLDCRYEEFNFFDGLRYTYTCTMFNNFEGVDVFNITKTSPPAVSMNSVLETIFELVGTESTK